MYEICIVYISQVRYRLTALQPFTVYQISVRAFTAKGEGLANANALSVLTDVAQPGSPQILNVSRVAENAIVVEWIPPRRVFKQLDLYYIQYTVEKEDGQLVDAEQLLHLPVSLFSINQVDIVWLIGVLKYVPLLGVFSSLQCFVKAYRLRKSPQWFSARACVVLLVIIFVSTVDCGLIFYRLFFQQSSSNLLEQSGTQTRALSDDVSQKFPTEQAVITNLTTNRVYHIQVSAATKSIIDADKIYRSEPSLAFSMDLATHTAVAKRITESGHELTMAETVILILVIVTIGILSIFCGLFCAFRSDKLLFSVFVSLEI